MSLELPSRESIDSEIMLMNQQLVGLSAEAESQDLKPMNTELLHALSDGHSKPQDNTTTAGFWNHHIGGPLAAIDVQMYLLEVTGQADEEIVSSVQARLYRLAIDWSTNPESRDPIVRSSTDSFLAGGFSFEWMKSPILTRKLKGQVTDLGDLYAMREGHHPLNFRHIIQKKAEPSRAYLLCSNP